MLTELTEQSVSWTTICCYDVNKILALFINRNFIHPLDVIIRERNSVHNFPRLFFSIPFNIPPKRTLKLHSHEYKIAEAWLGHSPRTANFTKIRPVRAEMFLADGWTDRRRDIHDEGSRLKKSNNMQQYADTYLLLNYSTCFGRPSRPSSGVHKIGVAAR